MLRDGDGMNQRMRSGAEHDQLLGLSVVTQKLQVLLSPQPLLQFVSSVGAHVNARYALQ